MVLFFTHCLFSNQIFAQVDAFEKSDPYLELLVEDLKVNANDTVIFTVVYGNRGPDLAKDVKLTFNQPLDGRSSVLFVSSDPEPSNWLSNEYGNLAEFSFPELKVDALDHKANEIIITTRIRSSVPSQTITPSVSLYAPYRAPGKKLVMSEAIFLDILNKKPALSVKDKIEGVATSSGSELDAVSNLNYPSAERKLIEINPVEKNSSTLFNFNHLTLIVFIFIVLLLMVGSYFAGRKSRT
jgi:hypothetical protein